MEKIHLKTVDSISQTLLRAASEKGLELPWERFEKLQPQDGFLRLGLSCPFGCLHGPCRIDPFGRGPRRGVCGLDGNGMAAGMLLRLCLHGTMEAAAAAQSEGKDVEIQYSSTLEDLVKQALSKGDQGELSAADIYRSYELLHRPSCGYQTLVSQALRLCLITLAYLEQSTVPADDEAIPFTCGYGVLVNQSVRIGFCGTPSRALVDDLEREAARQESGALQLAALGDWILLKDRYMPIACSSGETELLVGSGVLHLLVAGPEVDPGLIELCEQVNLEVVTDQQGIGAEEIVHRARRIRDASSQLDLFSELPAKTENKVLMTQESFLAGVKHNAGKKLAIIGGSDTFQMSLGDLPVELATGLHNKELQLAGWGDGAVWLAKAGMSASAQSAPFLSLDDRQGPLLAVKALAADGALAGLRGICFTGMRGCKDLALALGLAYLGCRVSVATPIPIQGSSAVTGALSEMLAHNGGQLLHFDYPAQVEELVEWYTNP